MSDADFDIIVVGSGCAGAVAAYVAASAGKSVLVVERGNYAGAKNMTGGRIYSHSLKEVFPDFESEASLERKITHERIAMLNSDSEMTIDFTSPVLAEEGKDSYWVLRGPFDQWLAEKAEDAGAEYICGIAVEELLKDESGKVVGIRAGEDEITSQVVIVAEGTNTLLSERCLGNARPAALPDGRRHQGGVRAARGRDRGPVPSARGRGRRDAVRRRLHPRQGRRRLFVHQQGLHLAWGSWPPSPRRPAARNDTPVYQMLEDFKGHPAVAPIIRGRRRWSSTPGTWCPRAATTWCPSTCSTAALLAGEAAGLCMNMGYQVRGMDFAVASGRSGRRGGRRGHRRGRRERGGACSGQARRMEDSFVIKDLKTFRKWPHVMEEWDAMFNDYPTMAAEVFNAMFSVDGQPAGAPACRRIMPIIKKRGLFKTGQRGAEGGEARCEPDRTDYRERRRADLPLEQVRGGRGERPHRACGRIRDIEEFKKLVRVCPAALYKIGEDGATEPSTTPAAWSAAPAASPASGTIVRKWENPQPTMGVEYRFG